MEKTEKNKNEDRNRKLFKSGQKQRKPRIWTEIDYKGENR